jgi:hypothetical protein
MTTTPRGVARCCGFIVAHAAPLRSLSYIVLALQLVKRKLTSHLFSLLGHPLAHSTRSQRILKIGNITLRSSLYAPALSAMRLNPAVAALIARSQAEWIDAEQH